MDETKKPAMSRPYRLQIRASDEELSRWEVAADRETLSVATWARRELERAARTTQDDTSPQPRKLSRNT